jgi:Tfp pilus assembly protein PilF
MRRNFVKAAVLFLALLPVSAATGLAQAPASATQAVPADALAARIQSAEAALEKQDYATAETLLKQLATEQPKSAQVLYDLGFAEEHNGHEEDAAKAYNAALAVDSKLTQARLALGLLDARTNHTDQAHGEFAAVAAQADAPPQLRARALRALARLHAESDASAASGELLQAIQLTGETPEDQALAAELAARSGDAAGSEQAYRATLANEPGNVDATVGLAHALKAEGKLADADTMLAQALTAHPDEPRLIAELATVDAAENKDADAITLLESLRAKDASAANNPAVVEMLARLYAMNGREADAEPLYRSLLAASPDDPMLLDALGGVLLRQAKYAEAERVLARAVVNRAAFHDDTAWAESATHLALAAERNHEPQVALQALAARATVLPNSPASLFLEAAANDALHRYTDAVRLYRAFLAVAAGKFPDEEFEARHRLVALEHMR